MKTSIKIFILLLAITCAIGGVMIYAKTKVAPPVSIKQLDQYSQDIYSMSEDLSKAGRPSSEDAIYFDAMNRIRIFSSEGKLSNVETDKLTGEIVNRYAPLFLSRCFDSFRRSNWEDSEHNYILSQIRKLQSIKQSDNSSALSKQYEDSLNMVSQIISDYRAARQVSHSTSFTGISNAQATISKARSYANHAYLSKCTTLVADLNNVPSKIAQSHYSYISEQVEKLAMYHSYSQSDYENTLVPQVDAALTEYDNKAAALYGSKKNIDDLLNQAMSYYERAMIYYSNNN